MSDDEDWIEALRQIEREIGRPLTASERSSLAAAKPGLVKMLAERNSAVPAHHEKTVLGFMRKLMARQGTSIPDFDTLYQKKAALDRKLFGP